MNILQLQLKEILNNGLNLINNLRDGEALFIIDKNKHVRELFFYENNYFLTDEISINIDSIDIADSITLCNLCEYINNTNIKHIKDARLLKNKEKFIKEYMTDNLIIHVDKVNNNIIETAVLSYYNNLIMISANGIYLLKLEDDGIIKYELEEYYKDFRYNGQDNNEYIDKLLIHIYKNIPNIFPVEHIDIRDKSYLYESDIVDETIVFMMINISCNKIISNLKVYIDEEAPTDNLYNIIYDLITIDKNKENIQEEIKRICLKSQNSLFRMLDSMLYA